MKSTKMNYPDPFDDSAIARQMRMGLLTSGGMPNKKAIAMLAQVYAALFFDRLCDLNVDMERCVRLCEDLSYKLQTGDGEKLLFSVCVEYDEHLMPLPAPIWWCLSNKEIMIPYINEFVRCLSWFVHDSAFMGKH